MKFACLISFLVVAIAIHEVYSIDSRCGAYGRKKRSANYRGGNSAFPVRMQTFYKYNKGSSSCVSFQSQSGMPGNAGFASQSECQHACVQRPLDNRCGSVTQRKPEANGKVYTFYRFDKSRSSCVSYQTGTSSPGTSGFRTRDECHYVCVQRHG